MNTKRELRLIIARQVNIFYIPPTDTEKSSRYQNQHRVIVILPVATSSGLYPVSARDFVNLIPKKSLSILTRGLFKHIFTSRG